MNRELRGAEVTPRGLRYQVHDAGQQLADTQSQRAGAQFMRLDVGREFSGLANLTLDAKAGLYRDSVTRTLDVQAPGFPREVSTGACWIVMAPSCLSSRCLSDIVRGSVSSSGTVYPTPLASMTDALQSLLQQPNGCFEQTSSTELSNGHGPAYFLTHTGVDPALVEKAKGLLEISYKKLTG
jgi:uncharacterized protein YfaS (alpha-2-macroglobulin family)